MSAPPPSAFGPAIEAPIQARPSSDFPMGACSIKCFDGYALDKNRKLWYHQNGWKSVNSNMILRTRLRQNGVLYVSVDRKRY